jgi:RNA polymerase sigma-70 factor (ECF subfamily)
VHADQQLVRSAIDGDRPAIDALVARLSPIIQARVARLLLSRGRAQGRDLRAQVEDMTQEVFLGLFDQNARALKAWEPARGLSLENWVGLIAHRQAISLLRAGATNPFTEDATEDEALGHLATAAAEDVPTIEARLASREAVVRVLDHLHLSLSPRSLELFHRLYVEEESVDAVTRSTGMTAAAVHTWRSRLGKLARQAAAKVLGDEESRSDRATLSRRTEGTP